MKATDRATCRLSLPARRFGGAVGTVLLLGAACLAQTLPPVTPDKVLVASVIIQGNHNVPTGKVLSLIKTRQGREYNRAVLEDDVRELTKTKLFADVRVVEQMTAEQKVNVYFQLREHPSLVQEIVYQGAKHVKPGDLESITGLKRGVPLSPVANELARQAILRKYHEKGRMLASVDLLEGAHEGDTRVVFNITEGPVSKVKSIDFTGVQFVSKSRLRTQISSSSEFLGLIGGKFDPLMADQDVLSLERYYRSFGFHDVRVSRELQYDLDPRYVHLIFHIQAGQRYQVAGVDAGPVSCMSRQEETALLKLKPGTYYNQHEVDADQKRLKDALGYRGHEAMTHERLTYQDPAQVVVFYEIEEMPAARVKEIIIQGNDVTKDRVIRRQIPLYPGQILTYPDLRVAEENLARLGIFEVKPEMGIRPTLEVRDSPNEYKDVIVHVQETATGSLLFGVGVNSDYGLTGSIVLNERNFDITNWPKSFDHLLSGQAFRGAGQELRIEAVPGTELQRYMITFREPALLDSPYSLAVSGYYYTRIFNEYNETRLGSRVTVGRKLNQYWTASAGVRVEDVGVHNVSLFAPEDFQRVAGQNFLLALRAGATRDSRDSYLRPTQGSLVDVSFEEVLGDFTFPVIDVEGNKYWTTWQRADGSGRHVLAFRSEVGWAGSNAPVYERFYAGGFRSMRGFEFRGVGPDINGFKVGGDFMFLNSLEYQIPVRANDQLYFVGFIDSGTVEPKVEINNYRVSAGLGVRIIVPLLGPVPIALDFGVPVIKAPGDRRQLFSFWIGFFGNGR